MPASLRAAGGSYGLGVRPMRGTFISGRTVQYGQRQLFHPSVPNGSFHIDTSFSTLTVIGVDANSQGSATASSLIDGTGQAFSPTFALYSEIDNCFYALVTNAQGEARLVRALFNGTISTPGAKFASSFIGNFFCYEEGNNIVVRFSGSGAVRQQVVSKSNGQPLSPPTLISESTHHFQQYISEDQSMTFGQMSYDTEGFLYVQGLSYNGKHVPRLLMSSLEVFGLLFRDGASSGISVMKTGNYLGFINTSNGLAVAPFPLVERAEFDRWLRDVINKFNYA